MKKLINILLLIPIIFIACKDEVNNDNPALSDNEYVNKWIYSQMQTYYLWEDKLPTNPVYDQTPDKFFSSLLYNYGQSNGDRFSWIRDNFLELQESLSGVSSHELGFELTLYSNENDNTLIGQVLYVKPNTPAAAKELNINRGDCFTKVDGQVLTTSNYGSLLFNDKTSTEISFVTFKANSIEVATEVKKSISKLSKYSEDPVYYYDVLTHNASGKKIGYLIYNFFAADKGDESGTYDLKLNDWFGKFKSENISELIIDLRYNSGGSVMSCIYMASMIVPNLSTNNVFTKLEYNNKRKDKSFAVPFFNKINNSTPINNVGNQLSNKRVFILTGRNTASASEMIINGLTPYMDVYIIGDKTIGKNVGSETIYKKDDSRNKWGMQPITLYFYNANNWADFGGGFMPTGGEGNIEKDNYLNKYTLGDTRELLLNKALAVIDGGIQKQATKQQGIGMFEVGSSIDRKPWTNKAIADGINPSIPNE